MQDGLQALVVDGDARAALALVRALSEQGCVVGAALTAADGLEEAERNEYDLVLTAARLPDLDGAEFAERIRASTPRARIVRVGPETDAMQGFDVAIERPADADAAVDAVDAMFESLARVEAEQRRAATGRVPMRDLKGWRKVARFLSNVALFLISPFISLSYMIALPLVGFYSFMKTTLAGWQNKGGRRAP